jgi:hypothetical protein
MSKAAPILEAILEEIELRLIEIAQAQASDSEINAGGNGYNSSEAGGYFHDFVETINLLLEDDQKLEFPEAADLEEEESDGYED